MTLLEATIPILEVFGPLFTSKVSQHVRVLLVGSILTPGRRTVCTALRVMGLSLERQFQSYHRVLNRDAWSSRQGANGC